MPDPMTGYYEGLPRAERVEVITSDSPLIARSGPRTWIGVSRMPDPMTGSYEGLPRAERVEVITSVQRRRRWSTEEKVRIVEETYLPGNSVSLVARRHGIAGNQLFTWRRLMAQAALTAASAGEEVVPTSEWTCSGTVESCFREGGGFRWQTRRRASPLRSAPRPCGLPRPAGAPEERWPAISGSGGPRCGTGSTAAAIGRGSRRLLTVRRTGRR